MDDEKQRKIDALSDFLQGRANLDEAKMALGLIGEIKDQIAPWMPRPQRHAETADYVVLRGSPDRPEEWMPRDLEGRWYDLRDFRKGPGAAGDHGGGGGEATFVPTGRFEYRDDGAVAEVWEWKP